VQSAEDLEEELLRLATAPTADGEAIERWLCVTQAAGEVLGAAAPTSEEVRSLSPTAFGAYRVVGSLGAGGMGVVLEVRHAETGAGYALKTVLASEAGHRERVLARFRREAELNARLDHPGVVRIHAAEFEGPEPYLVQELLPGGTLTMLVEREGPLTWEEALRITREVSAALLHAHERGVVHRDLKPENVLFAEDGGVRLVDFGLAVSLAEGSLRLTNTGEIVGSPAFMAPEQIRGGSGEASVDLYALGGLLYYMLTGEPPLTSHVTNLVVLFRAILIREPSPPSELRPGLPPGFDGLTLALLAKDPAERPSLRQVQEWLEAIQAGRGDDPPTAARPGRGGLARAPALLLVIGFVLALGALGFAEHQRGARIEAARAYALGYERDLLGSAPDPVEAAAHLLEVPPRGELHRRLLALQRWGRWRNGEQEAQASAPDGSDALERLVNLLIRRAEGAPLAGLLERLEGTGRHPSRAALRFLFSTTPAELEEAYHSKRIAHDLVRVEFERRLCEGYARAFARPGGEDEALVLANHALAVGANLGAVERAKREARDEFAGAWLGGLTDAQIEERVRAWGDLLRAPPRIGPGDSLRRVARAFLQGEARRRVAPGSHDNPQLRGFLHLNGLLRLELGRQCYVSDFASFGLTFLGTSSRHMGEGLDVLALVGALDVVPAHRVSNFAVRLELSSLEAQAGRSGWGVRLSYLALASQWGAISAGTIDSQLTDRLRAALDRDAEALQADHYAMAWALLARALSYVAIAKKSKALGVEAARVMARAQALRKDLMSTVYLALVSAEAGLERLAGGSAYGLEAWARAVKVIGSLPTRHGAPSGKPYWTKGRALLNLAGGMISSGQLEEVRPLVESALSIQKANGKELGAEACLARLLRKQGEPEQAWRVMIDMGRDRWLIDEATCVEAAIQLAARGRLEEALALLEQGGARLPHSLPALRHLAARLRAEAK
jgi:hypothetical protein